MNSTTAKAPEALTSEELIATALRAADAAARVHSLHVGRLEERWIDEKTASSDFVSNVDLESQEAALHVIQAAHPDHYIMAEEGEHAGEMDPEAPYTWIVDPLDGTTNFLHNHPFYASSVAVWDKQGPVAAVVHSHPLETVWSARRGMGAHANGEVIHVSKEQNLNRCLVGTGFPFKNLEALDTYQGQFGRVLGTTAGIRRAGAAAIDLAYLAEGRLDAFWELHLNPWDFAAGILLITEAGGCVSRVGPGAVDPTPGSVLAGNSRSILEELRAVLRG